MNLSRLVLAARPASKTVVPTRIRLCGLPERTRNFHPTFLTEGRWAKVQGKKSAEDAKKGAMFSKAIQNIVIAAKVGGSPDPTTNHALAVALKNARTLGLPKDNIQAAMNRITNPSAQDAQLSTTYEAIGPGQVGLVIECLTDNTTRTAKKIREILSSNGARLAPVAYQFSRCGQIRLTPAEDTSFESVWDMAIDAGAEDVTEITAEASESGSPEIMIKTPPNQLATLASKVSEHTLHSVELAYAPAEEVEPNLSSPDQEALEELIEELEENSDVVRVWTSI
ncbi:YebC-like protein [Ceratobasidium sp. AG-I]|nr:YebC-like protein [Ceratobasidium sp. AG-I]